MDGSISEWIGSVSAALCVVNRFSIFEQSGSLLNDYSKKTPISAIALSNGSLISS